MVVVVDAAVVKLDEAVGAAYQRLALDREVPVSVVIRDALIAYLWAPVAA